MARTRTVKTPARRRAASRETSAAKTSAKPAAKKATRRKASASKTSPSRARRSTRVPATATGDHGMPATSEVSMAGADTLLHWPWAAARHYRAHCIDPLMPWRTEVDVADAIEAVTRQHAENLHLATRLSLHCAHTFQQLWSDIAARGMARYPA